MAASGLGDKPKQDILTYFLLNPSPNPFAVVPTTVYLALSTTAVTGTGTGSNPSTITEPPAGNGYSRIAIPTGVVNWTLLPTDATPSGGSAATMPQVALTTQQIFGPASGTPWAQIVAIALMDSGTVGTGHVLFVGTVTPSNTGVPIGSTFLVPATTGFVCGIFS